MVTVTSLSFESIIPSFDFNSSDSLSEFNCTSSFAAFMSPTFSVCIGTTSSSALSSFVSLIGSKPLSSSEIVRGGIFSTPLSTLSLCTSISLDGSCFISPFTGSNTGEDDGLMRTTLSFFSSISLPLSFANILYVMSSSVAPNGATVL
ncbi:hypothetical protein V8G54_014948 [Vigna mungo]|uniref:Uncharacterized protein n=1 Tax=Vigna mungo TaxID=3915 RepID=A0AAQ3NLI6_VIGMU